MLEAEKKTSSFSEEELGKMLWVKTDAYLDGNELELASKDLVDELILKYGLLGAMKNLLDFYDDAVIVRRSISKDKRLQHDLSLFIISISSLIARISQLYKPNIYLKLLVQFSNIRNGSFDEKKYISSITEQIVDQTSLLGLDFEFIDQKSLYEIIEPTLENSLHRSINTRTEIIEGCQREIVDNYTATEISMNCDRLSAILANDPNSSTEEIFVAKMIKDIKSELRKLKPLKKKGKKQLEGQMRISL